MRAFLLTKREEKGTIQHIKSTICRGSSVVERKPEELSVVGSIPTLGTNLRQGYGWQAILNMANLIVVISRSKMYEK